MRNGGDLSSAELILLVLLFRRHFFSQSDANYVNRVFLEPLGATERRKKTQEIIFRDGFQSKST